MMEDSARARSSAFASCSCSLPDATPQPGNKSRRRRQRCPQPVFELSADVEGRPSVALLARHKPVALVALMPKGLVLFTAGAMAGAVGKTLTAPLDRLKILMQVKGAMSGGALQEAANSGSLLKAFVAIGKQQGITSYWKGNLPQVLRVIPYSAAQLCGYEFFKSKFVDSEGKLTMPRRLCAGACAGMASTLVTYPLDTLRLRLAVDSSLRTIPSAIRILFAEGSYAAFFRGLTPALIGIAPYMAIELATYDMLPSRFNSFTRGFAAALLATSFCYPLDTVRRQIQLHSASGISIASVVTKALREEGVTSFYRGFVPNALKNLPNKGIRLSIFDRVKQLLSTSEQELEQVTQQYKRGELFSANSSLSHRV